MNLRATIRRRTAKEVLWRLTPARLCWASSGERGNFGDELSPLLIRRLFGIKVKHSGMDAADLVATGSLLEWAEDRVAGMRPVVWGSGFIEDGGPYRGRPLDVRAVRGELSLQRLPDQKRAVALGDPGLLASLAFPRSTDSRRDDIGLVPHFTDWDHPSVQEAREDPRIRVIDPLGAPASVVDMISRCRVIVSSSLHGLVVAESYGIPSVWTRIDDGIIGGSYKFRDYYSAFGVSRHPLTLEEALANAGDVRRQWQPLPGLERITQDLLRTFPVRPLRPAHRGRRPAR